MIQLHPAREPTWTPLWRDAYFISNVPDICHEQLERTFQSYYISSLNDQDRLKEKANISITTELRDSSYS